MIETSIICILAGPGRPIPAGHQIKGKIRGDNGCRAKTKIEVVDKK
jgi:hypothetical protein